MRLLAALAFAALSACAAPPAPAPEQGASGDIGPVLARAQLLHAARLDAYAAALAQDRPVGLVRDLPFETTRPEPWARTVIYDFGVARDSVSNVVREDVPRGPVMPVEGRFVHAGVEIALGGIAWDHVLVRLGGAALPDAALAEFAAIWQDGASRAAPPRRPGLVHAIHPRRDGVLVDFGTAPPAAFLDLVERLGAAGISRVEVSAGS